MVEWSSETIERLGVDVLRGAEDGCEICHGAVVDLRKSGPLPEMLRFNFHAPPIGKKDTAEAGDGILWIGGTTASFGSNLRLRQLRDTPAPEPSCGDDLSTGSHASLSRAAEWLYDCIANHKPCHQQITEGWVPTRLLDLGASPEFDGSVRLHLTASNDAPVRYATLSHRWGDAHPTRLLRSNLESFARGVSLSLLPKTFREAIYVARSFGLRYIWIDSLCIIQDSDQDWTHESSLMTYVYGSCVLNIAAAGSRTCHDGLFRSRRTQDVGPIILALEDSAASRHRYHLIPDLLWMREVDDALLNTRGWVFQERILSPRTLIFSDARVFWECRCRQGCIDFSEGYREVGDELEGCSHDEIARRLFDAGVFIKANALFSGDFDETLFQNAHDNAYKIWKMLVVKYSRLSLTIETDKLVAIGGLAGYFNEVFSDVYLAGMWRSTLLDDLLWYANPERVPGRRPSIYRAPSWSWASLDGAIMYTESRKSDNTDLLATVASVNIVPVSEGNETGQIRGGSIHLRGKLFDGIGARAHNDKRVFDKWRTALYYRKAGTTVAVAVGDEAEREGAVDITDKLHLICLPIWMNGQGWEKVAGLVLVPADEHPQGYYKRWGYFEVTSILDDDDDCDLGFFGEESNMASSGCYVKGEDGTIVLV